MTYRNPNGELVEDLAESSRVWHSYAKEAAQLLGAEVLGWDDRKMHVAFRHPLSYTPASHYQLLTFHLPVWAIDNLLKAKDASV